MIMHSIFAFYFSFDFVSDVIKQENLRGLRVDVRVYFGNIYVEQTPGKHEMHEWNDSVATED